jgi:hypothetical protein
VPLEEEEVSGVSEKFATFIFKVWIKSGEESQVRYPDLIFTLFPSLRIEETFSSTTSATKPSSTQYEHLPRRLTLRDKLNK